MDARIWICLIKNILKLSFVRFNMYNIYAMNKAVPVYRTSVHRAEIHDLERKLDVCLLQMFELNW
jgi:hypothetical protein